MQETSDSSTPPSRGWPDYRAVWRWHFYAGMFCVPFVIILSITGTIYLFKPQIEAWNDRAYDNLQDVGERAGSRTQVEAALAAVPGSTFQACEFPTATNNATRVLVDHSGESTRVYVHPATSQVLYVRPDESGIIPLVKRIHGELMIGNNGSHIVELAACWTVVMILSGLFLWWPRNAKGLGGIIYPRFNGGSRMFWRDIHGVTGVWISSLALFLVITGLPWANFWGEYFKGLRRLTGTAVAKQEWSTGSESSKTVETAESGKHKGHAGHESGGGGGGPWRRRKGVAVSPEQLDAIDRVIAAVAPLDLAPPVLISPSAEKPSQWDVASMTPNRPLRVNLVVDGASGEIVSRKGFQDRHIFDRAVGTGIAIHEGQMFGWLNQLLALLTTSGLVLLSVSGVVLWWRRRNLGVLGAPAVGMNPRLSWGLVAFVALLGIALPLFGASLIIVLICERFFLRRIPPVKRWLGLRGSDAQLAAE
ncbi:MAG: PepSY-associated TM helix domain-containing protein [Planctomycetaceae bacterium]